MSHTEDGNDRTESDGPVVYRSTVDPDEETPFSTGVLMALDSVPGFDVEDSDTVVFDHVDLGALDELFRPVDGESQARVTFPVDGYEVTVTAAGEITIRTR
jgi:hypothetical protein